jgi:hypothetical protein
VTPNWDTIASLATAAGTLVLAVATFSAVRSGNRTARAAETSLQAGLAPLLIQSRRDAPEQKIMFSDERWVKLPGGSMVGDADGDHGQETVYLAMSLHNAGSGVAVIHGWRFYPQRATDMGTTHPPPDTFRLQGRDLYIPVNDTGFWQAAFRDHDDPEFTAALEAIRSRMPVTVDLLYGDQQGGQRVITRFSVSPRDDNYWMPSVIRYWNVDRPDPRPRR